MLLPRPRGPFTAALIEALRGAEPSALPAPPPHVTDPLGDDELQLALWICYELAYLGFDDVAETWEREPALLGLRNAMEDIVLDALHREVVVPQRDAPVADQLWGLVNDDQGPGLSRFVQLHASRDQFLEFVVHRSIYQLKEADPHTWAIPRLTGRPKAALVEIQIDEYGAGRQSRMHSEMYRTLMRSLDLDHAPGAYVDAVPGITLAISNVMSLFGLRRQLRGALVGHLAAYEMTSSEPCRRYAKGFRRLGGDDAACEFYDVHVTADALHEQIAAHDLCGGLAEAQPHLTGDILFGAAACLYVDNRFAEYVLGCWQQQENSLHDQGRVLPAAS